MPRKPRLTVVRPGVDGRPNRLSPPPDLDPTEKQLFGELVRSCPPEHFRPSDMPLLVEYVKESVLVRQASDEMAKTGGPIVDGITNPWFGILQRATRVMCILSTRLRLNPQSRLHSKSVHRQVGYQRPSYYDTMADEDA
jgi:phage terminase small subunit